MKTKIKIIRQIESHEQFGGPTLPVGMELYIYYGCTYGCISPGGQAVSINGETPFFQIPQDSFKTVSIDIY